MISCTAKPIKFKILSRLKQVYHGGRYLKINDINAHQAVKQLFRKGHCEKRILIDLKREDWDRRSMNDIEELYQADSGRTHFFLKMARANKPMRIQKVDENSFFN